MLWQHFGLGSRTSIDSLIVLWPYGITERKQILRNVQVNTSITIDECAIGIQQTSNEIPDSYFLSQNYPNPFNPSTKIRFDVPSVGAQYIEPVQLRIYDILCREVATLVNEQLKPGTYEVEWPAPTGDATNYPSGVYFYKLISGEYSESKRMVLVK
jgi:hypothetical protein